ncbi:ornithine decarboxylase [uncultured Veillonella sp.]|uniref:ornithine decarboxylase n=1 Tax=uncultured Veillonella sp. TaxID=159268 RepID=UPI0025E5AFF6|nr:ornithine decarboxylase [uncultured Veillonella sp.]MDY3973241.1 ornithine decarboxylase [Veillonella caviae]
MNSLSIACSTEAVQYFTIESHRPQENLDTILNQVEPDFTAVGAVVVTDQELEKLPLLFDTLLGIPTFIVRTQAEVEIPLHLLTQGVHIIDVNQFERLTFSRQIEDAIVAYEARILPPFFKELVKYVESGHMSLATPGHHGGSFFRKHPAGRYFYDWFGEPLFRSDMSSSDVKMGDMLIHEGFPYDAEKHAAEVFNADFTYFVLNGTSSANKVVCNALIKPGDVVLFDRNNHKSLYHGALVQSGATPVYVETSRNPFGFIGGVDYHCFEESYLRERIAKVAPHKAEAERPFRVALIQLGTYDGTIYNARQVVDRIGHLCDYILFDSAWVGYEQFIPMMRDCSPMLLELGPNDPGIFVTQSVHKQLAGFSQTSQIHKKDSHIKGQARYCNDDCFNNAFMLQASTSPCYPLFASLDVNAKIHEGPLGRKMWADTVKLGIYARKAIKQHCHYLKSFVPDIVNGREWDTYTTEEIAENKEFFSIDPEASWHQFKGYEKNQYLVDPCKLLVYTPGIDGQTGDYEDFGIPASVLSHYLQDHGLTPEKCDLNSILFLLTPADSETMMNNLVSLMVRFERCIDEDVPMKDVLPKIYYQYEEHYRGYTIRQLCQEMHDFYKKHKVNTLQKRLFREEYFPEVAITAQAATQAFIGGNYEMVTLDEVKGRIALEGALPYPPGIITIGPGERWNDNVIAYFKVLEDTFNELPGFTGEIQGVHFKEIDGKIRALAYVMKDE